MNLLKLKQRVVNENRRRGELNKYLEQLRGEGLNNPEDLDVSLSNWEKKLIQVRTFDTPRIKQKSFRRKRWIWRAKFESFEIDGGPKTSAFETSL